MTHHHSAWVPAPIDEVEKTIAQVRPGVVFAPHVETAAGMLLPDDYVRRLAAAVHAVGGVLVPTASPPVPRGSTCSSSTSTCSSRHLRRAGAARRRQAMCCSVSTDGRPSRPRPPAASPRSQSLARIADAYVEGRTPITQPCRPTRSWPTLRWPRRPWHAAGQARGGAARVGRGGAGKAGRSRLRFGRGPGVCRGLRRRRPHRRPSPPVRRCLQAGRRPRPPACRSSAANQTRGPPSDSDSSGSTNSMTYPAPSNARARSRPGHDGRLTSWVASSTRPTGRQSTADQRLSGQQTGYTQAMSTRWLDAEELATWVRLVAVTELLPSTLTSNCAGTPALTHFEYLVLAMLSEDPGHTLQMSALPSARTPRCRACLMSCVARGPRLRRPHPQQHRCPRHERPSHRGRARPPGRLGSRSRRDRPREDLRCPHPGAGHPTRRHHDRPCSTRWTPRAA